MSEESELEIYICGACRPKGAADDDPRRPGRDLIANLQEKLTSQGLDQRFKVKIMQCMSVCKRPATMSIMSPSKFTYTVGDLDPETTADDIITFAKFYAETKDGIPAWGDRPESIRQGTIARTPAPGMIHQRVKEVG